MPSQSGDMIDVPAGSSYQFAGSGFQIEKRPQPGRIDSRHHAHSADRLEAAFGGGLALRATLEVQERFESGLVRSEVWIVGVGSEDLDHPPHESALCGWWVRLHRQGIGPPKVRHRNKGEADHPTV